MLSKALGVEVIDRKGMRLGEQFIYLAIVLLFAFALGLQFAAPDLLESVYLAEDRFLEWLTVVIFAFLPVLILPQQLLESDELAEVCGAMLLVAVFCYARNRYIYSPVHPALRDG